MVEVLIAGVVGAVGGYLLNKYFNSKDERHRFEALQEKLRERLRSELCDLEENRSTSRRRYFLKLILLFASLIALVVILNVSGFFRYTDYWPMKKKWFEQHVFDWKSWINYKNFTPVLRFNHYGIGLVVVGVTVVVLLFRSLYNQACDVTRIEIKRKQIQDKLQRLDQEGAALSNVKATAQGGVINIAIGSCFNVYCTCYVTFIVSSTCLAFLGVTGFICYVMYISLK